MHSVLAVKLLGVIGGLCFALSGIPTALKTIKDGFTHIPMTTTSLVFAGTIFMYSYLYLTFGFDILVFFDYFITFSSWGIVLMYSLKR